MSPPLLIPDPTPRAFDRVFRIQELVNAILDYLRPFDIGILCLVSKSMLQCCHYRAHLILTSREFDDDDETERQGRENTSRLSDAQFDPKAEEIERLSRRFQRHREGILTPVSQAMLRTLAYRLRILDLQIDRPDVSQWGRCLLKEAHSLGNLRIDRATLRFWPKGLPSDQRTWDEIFFSVMGSQEQDLGTTGGLVSATERSSAYSLSTSVAPSARLWSRRSLLFERLKSLTIDVHNLSPDEYYLDGLAMSLFHGGGQPGLIASTLTSLSITVSAGTTMINWYELRVCLVALKVLNSLEFRDVILDAADKSDHQGEWSSAVKDGHWNWNECNRSTEAMDSLRRLTLGVRFLNPLVRRDFMDMVSSRVEILHSTGLHLLLDLTTQIKEEETPGIASNTEIWPRLKQLHIEDFDTVEMSNVDLILSWIRNRRIRLTSVGFGARGYEPILERMSQPCRLESNTDGTSAQTATSILEIPIVELEKFDYVYRDRGHGDVFADVQMMQTITGNPLTSSSRLSCCQSLRYLGIPNSRVNLLPLYLVWRFHNDSNDSARPSTTSKGQNDISVSEPSNTRSRFIELLWLFLRQLTPARVQIYMPIARTLEHLCLGTGITGIQYRVGHYGWCVQWFNKMLLGMPLLRIFELGLPLADLALFEGMGKNRSGTGLETYSDASPKPKSDPEWWKEEHPFLERLVIKRVPDAIMTAMDFEKSLYGQFRFLQRLQLS